MYMLSGNKGIFLGILITVIVLTLFLFDLAPKSGVTILDADRVAPGYTLFSQLNDNKTYLIDNNGQYVHSWEHDRPAGKSEYLLENGNLLRSVELDQSTLYEPGAGGEVELWSWDGELLWEYRYLNEDYVQHHDIEPMPNGNILMIVWDKISIGEALAMGVSADGFPGQFILSDRVIEVDPTTDTIVWEWDARDHVVQDTDKSKPNYGKISENPRRVDVNYFDFANEGDWLHSNSIDYNEELDQIMLSVRNLNEIWIIDHATTTEEAKGPKGDILYRWGNPHAYGKGGKEDRDLFLQHDAEWIAEGLPGAGNITIYDNGQGEAREWSRALEITPPLNEDGSYAMDGDDFLPAEIIWQYEAPEKESFYSMIISGTQRLANGNTLITEGTGGRFIEVTSEGDVVWEYINPVTSFQVNFGVETNWVFRANKYSTDYPAFNGKTFNPFWNLDPRYY